MNVHFLRLGLALIVAAARAVAQAPELLWETGGFAAPESIVFDAARDQYYVSNMGSFGQGATPGDGFISRVSARGEILELRWVDGLDSPKGLALANGRLYAGDDRHMLEINPANGAILARHQPEDGPGAFNDCTADAEGTVYVFSNRLGRVFRLRAGTFEPWFVVDRTQTGGLNGLKAMPDRLILGGWSLRGADGKDQPGHLSYVTFAEPHTLGRLGNEPLGSIDGIEPDGRGGYTVTDWTTGNVLQVSAEGKPTILFTLSRGAADHTYLPESGLLLIPHVFDHKVRAYRWVPAAVK
ncbi:MAG TPA: hypothetical protein VGD88_12785 [Opitutaceae bacterium]